MGYSIKIQTQGVEDILFSLLPLEIPEKTSFHPWKFWKIVWDCSEIPRSKTKTHENSTWVFLEHPYKFHFFFNWPLEIPHALLSIPLEVPCLQPPYLDFFWNSLLEVVFIYIKFQFCDILLSWSYCYTAVPWFGINFLLFILFPQRIYLIYNDSSDVCPCFSDMVSCFLQVSP